MLAAAGVRTGGRRTRPADLTERQVEVLRLVASGLSNREIASRLVISVRTVDGHMENILRKLDFSSRAQVAAWVARGGW